MVDIENLIFNVASFIAGLFLLEYGADKFIDHTALVAKRLNVSPTIVGLLTCGAEWEELIVIAIALAQKDSNMALGNLMGSCIANVLASFSLGLLFMREGVFDKSSKIYACALLALTTVFLLLLFVVNDTLKWIVGGFLVAAFVFYVGSIASMIIRGALVAPEDDSDSDSDSDSESDSDDDDDDESTLGGEEDDDGFVDHRKPTDIEHGRRSSSTFAEQSHELRLLGKAGKVSVKPKRKLLRVQRKPPKPLRYHVTRLLFGLGALLVSSYIIAHSASTIGRQLGLSGTVVGTTILSLATTLPEKFVAILGGVRHQPGIMIANTVGSNIFLVTLCGGITFLWGDVSQLRHAYTVLEASLMFGSAVLMLLIVLFGSRRWMGIVMLVGYIAFLAMEIVSGRQIDSD